MLVTEMKALLALSFMLFVCVQGSDNSRIVGGDNANIANFNYQASLRIQGSHTCGAVLIRNIRAVTAAHCAGSATTAYTILAGTTDRTSTTCATCALRPLLAINRHPGFANNPSAGYPNDIAVLWFNSIATNVNIGYITMAQEADGNFENALCAVSGWGRTTNSNTNLPTTLQHGAMSVISNAACIEVWNANRIRSEHLCASSVVVSMCGGDQGGPIVCNGRLAGIHSFGEANCGPTFPSVFVRISSYHDWILENSK